MNWYGCWTLLRKEVRRFSKVMVQTVASPVVTAMLYLLVFAQVLADRVEVYPGVSYVDFLVPGLIMMSVMQNAFANTSSSLIQSKMLGNLVFLLMAPLSAAELFIAYVAAAVARALLIALVLWGACALIVPVPIADPVTTLAMAVLSAVALAVLGLVAGIVADKFEHLAAFQNFFIMPASFLSGVFYSVHALPEPWREISHYNPFFYLIDGFRHGFFGTGDVPVAVSLAWSGGFALAASALGLYLLATGYKLRP